MPSNLRSPVALVAGETEAGAVLSRPETPPAGLARITAWLEARALYLAALAAVAVISLGNVYLHISQDSWLALLAGRLIAGHGIPQHDFFTVMTHGVRWIDQQWLAQLVLYELFRAGGLALVSVVYAAVTVGALGLAIAAARRLGATERSLVAILPVGTFFYVVTAVSVRTQGFAYPLFAATVWLLAAETRRPTRARAYLVFPLLVVWANLHGSVTMGVGVAVIFGLVTLLEDGRRRGWRDLVRSRGTAFVLGAPLTLLATPYGTAVIHYYRTTLLNPEFGKLVSEWRPLTSVMLLAVPYLLLLVSTVWMLGRSGRRTPLFDQLVLVMLALGGVFAVRNITWFGLAVVILMPATLAAIQRPKPAAPRRRRLNVTLATASIALAGIVAAGTFAHPARWFEQTYDARTVGVVARLTTDNPRAKVFADVRFADWLIWHDPALAGRLAYDTSFELLTADQLRTLSTLGQGRLPGQADPLARYSVFVLDPKNRTSNRRLLHGAGIHVVLRSKRVVVAARAAR